MIHHIRDLLHEQFELQPHLMGLMSFKRQSDAKVTPLLYLLCGALTCGLLGHPPTHNFEGLFYEDLCS